MTDDRRGPHDLRDGLLLSGGALLCYLLFVQDAFVNEDARTFLNLVGLGRHEVGPHPLYLPMAHAFAGALTPLGLSVFRSVGTLSVVATAIAVFCFHRALCHLQPDRRRRNLATALCALTPGVWFFATVIEIPAVLLAFAAGIWWLAARYLARPSWLAAGVLGLLTAVASLVHGTGHVLPLVMIAFVWTWPPRGAVPYVRFAAVVLAAHATASAGLASLVTDDAAHIGGSLDFFLNFDFASWPYALRVVAREWLLPFFPLSVLCFFCLRDKVQRLPALATLAVAGGYMFLSYVIIPGMWERGTYCLPWALFGASLAARCLSARTLALFVALAAITGVILIREHDQQPPDLLPAEVVIELAADQPILFVVGGVHESDAVLRAAPHIPIVRAFPLTASPRPDAEITAEFDHLVTAMEKAGSAVCFSESALAMMRERRPGFARYLEETFEFRRVESGWAAFRLVRKK